MIIQEILNEKLIRTYSDENVYIHGGYPEANYAEAIDPIAMHRTYIETDIPIESEYNSIDEEYAKIGRILMGVE